MASRAMQPIASVTRDSTVAPRLCCSPTPRGYRGPVTTQPIAVLPRRVIVVGAGLAGLRTVAELRGQGFDGEITVRSEEHTSELQSRGHLVCRLLLEKKKNL